MSISRREMLVGATAAVADFHCCRLLGVDERRPDEVAAGVRDFILRCARDDGGFSASPDPRYAGNSDTASSDQAAVTYAAVLAKTMGWELPRPKQSIAFIRKHQQRSGRFINLAGTMDPKSPLAVLYNFACHPIQGVASGLNTSDMTGFASLAIEDVLPEGSVALFVPTSRVTGRHQEGAIPAQAV